MLFCSVNTQMSQILFYSQFQQTRLSVKGEGSRSELQPCLGKGKETNLSQFLQSRRKAVRKTDQNESGFLAEGVYQNGIFHKKGLRWTLRRLGLILRAVCTFAAHSAVFPFPGVAVSPRSSGSQGVILPQRQIKAPETLPFSCSKASLTKMNMYPGLWEHPRFQAETGLMPVLCCGSCPFNSCEQLICLSFMSILSFLPQDFLLTLTFLPSFSPAQLSLPWEGLPLLQLFA